MSDSVDVDRPLSPGTRAAPHSASGEAAPIADLSAIAPPARPGRLGTPRRVVATPVPALDLTAELITHRFTPGSKEVLLGWYPRTRLAMDEESRSRKNGRFGAVRYVYPPGVMAELRGWFEAEIARRLPACRVLYWT